MKPQGGSILLSEPFALDSNFKRAAILLCEHSGEGSLGFILNKPLNMRINELIHDFPEFDAEVFYGGPVQTDSVHYVHNLGELLEDSVEVGSGVYWGGNFEKLKFLVSHELVKPRNIRFFVGYSGWSGGQLADEMDYGSWVLAEMDSNYIFKSEPRELWSQIMKNKGDNFAVIAQMPDSISFN
ncbi:MAG: YqgE/AlgH family protein [Saprospiraceae bacterium]|nr:YqgE/AlgH family protein [Saprospiraceae bacterium]